MYYFLKNNGNLLCKMMIMFKIFYLKINGILYLNCFLICIRDFLLIEIVCCI